MGKWLVSASDIDVVDQMVLVEIMEYSFIENNGDGLHNVSDTES